ncbi:YraN family protein [Stenoxybacter acetivorans]|uniref:YraN family protein n=1 Tax=Stenoxybacter acetivorans TaxID=422441 RepID=UPI00055D35B9|nr:YraN family protein [Stenoxybacter acetivorans]
MRLNHPQGAAAEEIAKRFLQAQGCRIVAQNWHCPFGEIDLIAKQGNDLIFVEVRFRKNQRYGGAAASIDGRKIGKLQRSAEYYLQTQHINCPCRIDAILLEGEQKPQWLTNITG